MPTSWECYDRSWKTYFGPSFVHSGVVYGSSSKNYAMMMTRQLGARGTLHEDQLLWSNQDLIRAGIVDLSFIRELKDRFENCSSSFDTFDREVFSFVEQPHPKKKLRQSAYSRLNIDGTLLSPESFCTSVKLKLKAGEYAKPGKPPRSIGDFGASAPLSGGWLVEACKDVFTQPLKVGSFISTFIKKPTLSTLDDVFHNIVNGDGNVAYIHSDDICAGINVCGTRLFFNIDISKCDGSNGSVIFELSKEILSTDAHKDLVATIVVQCEHTCSIFDLVVGQRILRFKGIGPIQYSGTVLTTLNNNIASNLIIAGISEMLPLLDLDTIEIGIQLGAALCGYKVTVERCRTYHDLQFLKHSPCVNEEGSMRAILNLGVVLRCLGQCSQDLPPGGSLEERAISFNSGLVRGMCHMGDHALHRTLKCKYPFPVKAIFPNYLLSQFGVHQRPSGSIGTHELLVRYSLTISEFEQMINCLDSAGFGDRIVSEASSVILYRDYGL